MVEESHSEEQGGPVKIGYARVSTVEQDLEVQTSKLLALGVLPEHLYFDRGFTGKRMTRDGLTNALKACRKGDMFVVPSMDRLARNTLGTLEVLRDLGAKGTAFNYGGQTVDPTNPYQVMVFDILAAVAQAEGGWISVRTKEAMARPSVKAALKGKQPSLTELQDEEIAGYLDKGRLTQSQIAGLFKTSRSTVNRAYMRHQERLRAAAGAPLTPVNPEDEQPATPTQENAT